VEIRTSLLATLHRARLHVYFAMAEAKPDFEIELRSSEAIRTDLVEKEAVLGSVGLRGPRRKGGSTRS
jgi:hypothetical protein